MLDEELTFDCGVQVYYSVVMNINSNKKTEEILLYRRRFHRTKKDYH